MLKLRDQRSISEGDERCTAMTAVNPGQFRVEMNSFLGEPRAFGLIRCARRGQRPALGIVIFFGLPSEGFQFGI